MRRTFLKTALAAIMATAACALAGNTAQAADLTVGANIGNVPWEFQDATGKNVGFEIDLVEEIGKRLGKSVEIVNIPFNGLFSAVQSGRIDMAVSSITITEKRLESVSFAQPYYDSDQSLTVLAKSGLSKVEDLKGKVIGVDTGSTGDMWATRNQAKYGFGDIRRFEGLQPAMLDLAAGRTRRVCQRYPGAAVLQQGQAAVQSGPAHPERRALFHHVRQEQPVGRAGERADHRPQEGRHYGVPAREVVRREAGSRHQHRRRTRHAEAQVLNVRDHDPGR